MFADNEDKRPVGPEYGTTRRNRGGFEEDGRHRRGLGALLVDLDIGLVQNPADKEIDHFYDIGEVGRSRREGVRQSL